MTRTDPHIVNVELGSRSYDIIIGHSLLDQAKRWIAEHVQANRVAIISDETVHGLHGARLEAALPGIDVTWILRPPGEAEKSFSGLETVLDGLFSKGFDRQDTIIAFGGGVIGDLTGFAAAIYKRGCKFIQIPTTLLAQVDSSVGGKTAINNRFGKNLIGAFYQPELVLIDTDVLKTLPEREIKAGYAEILKYGLLGDAAFFDWLDDKGTSVLALDPKALSYAIATSCQTKARIVAADERERGERALLNLGHSFAHALEIEAGYSGDLLHGEAVSAGMEMAFEFSHAMGLCTLNQVARVKNHLSSLGLTSITDVSSLLGDADRLLSHIGQDKKNEGGDITLILVRAIGDAFVQKAAKRDALHDYLQTLSKRAA